MGAATANSTLDATGKSITTFVAYEASHRLDQMAEGQTLEILTDDFEPFGADIAAWCEATGHRLVDSQSTSDGLRFVVETGSRSYSRLSASRLPQRSRESRPTSTSRARPCMSSPRASAPGCGAGLVPSLGSPQLG